VGKLLELNQELRESAWPFPFNETKHVLKKGDARDLSWISNRAVPLIVTFPPYWTLKQYEPHKSNVSQLGDIESYELFLDRDG